MLAGDHSSMNSRLAGAFRKIRRSQIDDDITGTMRTAGDSLREIDSFEQQTTPSFSRRYSGV